MGEALKTPFSDVIGCGKGKGGPHLLKIISGLHGSDRNVAGLASSIFPPASPFLLYFFKEKSTFALFLVLLNLVNLFCI